MCDEKKTQNPSSYVVVHHKMCEESDQKHNMTSHVRSWESYRFKERSQYTGKSLTCHYIFYKYPIPVPAWYWLARRTKPPGWCQDQAVMFKSQLTEQHWSWPISKSKWGNWVIMSPSSTQETEVKQNFTCTHIQSCNKQAEGKLHFILNLLLHKQSI
jgi:hypothetical protein